MGNKVKVGIVGCGDISGIYFKTCKRMEILDLVACADIREDVARKKGDENGVKAVSVRDLYADPEIRIVINLTTPDAHAEVALAAVGAGKSVYGEKPLTITRKDGQKLLALAKKKGVLVGCAPDTFMGGGIQTCRKLIDDGAIGVPVAANASMQCHGHESWHPNAGFYYQKGGGPMFDMGPYYLTALIALLGPVRRVTGATKMSFPERTLGAGPKKGSKVKVEVPTHIAGVLDFHSGAVATIVTSFDVWRSSYPPIEIHGTEGSLGVPDPNTWGGPVRLYKPGAKEWTDVPLTHGYAENSRGLGVAGMACALTSGGAHRASGELAYHVLDLMHAFHDAADSGKHVKVASTCERPAAVPQNPKPGTLDG